MRLLFIDDHKLILEGYKAILLSKKFISNQDVIFLDTLDEAFEFVHEQSSINKGIDLFLIDYSMPSSSKYKLNNGPDLIIPIKKKFPSAKIVLLTSEMSAISLFDCIQKTNPNGFWFKSDIDDKLLINYITAVLNGSTIYSESVQTSYDIVLKYSDKLDDHNRRILLLLSQGIKTKDLPNFIPLSLDTINHRKATIKTIVGVDSKDDYLLLQKAKTLGIL